MSLVYNSVAIVDLFSYIVSALRQTGNVDTVTVIGDNNKIGSNNEFFAGDIVTINAKEYKVISADSNSFDIVNDGLVSVDDTWTALGPYFMHGHGVEIANRLLALDGTTGLLKYQKYPLIALIQDFEEQFTGQGIYCKLSPITLVVMNITNPDYYASDRYDNNFKPIIYPLANDLIKGIDQSGFFSNISYRAIDRLFWGSQKRGANVVNDFIDARELILTMDVSRNIQQACSSFGIQII